MKVSRRRSLAVLASIAAAVPEKGISQSQQPAAIRPNLISSARSLLNEASRTMNSVKLARNIEPATRFEA
jgi:hypothetical protein